MTTIYIDFLKKYCFKFIAILFLIILCTCFIKYNTGTVLLANNDTKQELYYTSVCIDNNDTLWSIATEYYTDEYNSISNYISEIKKLNNMGSDLINTGNYILIPYYK